MSLQRSIFWVAEIAYLQSKKKNLGKKFHFSLLFLFIDYSEDQYIEKETMSPRK